MQDNFKTNLPYIEHKIGYVFRDKSLLKQAFTRTSFSNEHGGRDGEAIQSNEVLEFFGDTVLSLTIVTFLVKECSTRYAYGLKTKLNEGDFSNIKSKLSDKKNLSESMKRLGLEKYLLMGEGDVKLGVQNEPSVMEDLFESIVGAIYIDSDMNIPAVIGSVSRMLNLGEYLNSQPEQSAKNTLQEYCFDKKRRLPAPEYKVLKESGPDHKKEYEVGCYIGGMLLGKGVGKNRKIADAEAARAALLALKKENEKQEEKRQKSKQQLTKTSVKQPKKCDTPPSSAEIGEAADKLKKEAVRVKAPLPQYRDVGDAAGKEFVVECKYGSLAATGKGQTRKFARDAAAYEMLLAIGLVRKEKESARRQAKGRAPRYESMRKSKKGNAK